MPVVSRTDAAERDLTDVVTYIASDNLSAALA
jgi:plasmid stabilization system protein ParE